jgi:hypothetical protein
MATHQTNAQRETVTWVMHMKVPMDRRNPTGPYRASS